MSGDMAGPSFIGKVCVTAVLFLSAASLSAADDGPVTPYGDHCRDCTIYGTGREPISLPQAVYALKKYYEVRGYEVGILRYKGRFIEAEIYRERKQVDRVVFDRLTGRVRSIY
jgi:hypothetical protein